MSMISVLRKGVFAGFIACFSVAFASAASAATIAVSCPNNGGPDTVYSLTNSTVGQCHDGNDINSVSGSFELLPGLTGWTRADSTDAGAPQNNLIQFTTAPVGGANSGTWTIDTLAGLTQIAIVLKAGSSFAAFLIDLTVPNPLTGTWTSSRDLSHASIYYRGTPVREVPIPAALPLLLTGLGGLFAMGARRRKAIA